MPRRSMIIPKWLLARTAMSLLFCCLFSLRGNAQAGSSSSTDSIPICGVSPEFFASLGTDSSNNFNNITTSSIIDVSTFPSNLVVTCGKFKIYYADLVTSGAGGFASTTLGAARRGTLCAVLNYVETLIDFSNMASNEYIRLYVHPSYEAGTTVTAPVGTGWYAKAGPNHDPNVAGITNGYVYDFISSGNDPQNSNFYHAEMYVNFDATFIQGVSQGTPISYLNDYQGTLQDCSYDLYSILLHEVGHILGIHSYVKYNPTTNWQVNGVSTLTPAITNVNKFTGFDYSQYSKQNTNWYKLISGTLTNPQLNTIFNNNPQNNTIWVNNLSGAENYPVFSGNNGNTTIYGTNTYESFGGHFDEQENTYSMRQTVSPGNTDEYVMGPFGRKGKLRREFTKGEIQVLENLGDGSMGYQIRTTYPNYSILTGNHRPFSTKMAGYTDYYSLFFLDEVLTDYTMANNGQTYIYDITQDATISDADNDAISIVPESFVNIRGCGLNGNNHGQITLTNNNTRVNFTPRSNFFGRVQFGFNLTDGKEIGSFVIYTIDVTPGVYPSYTAGSSSLIVNGGYEEGTEVKLVGSDESKFHATIEDFFREGRASKNHYSDGHPYSFLGNWHTLGGGVVIRNSYINCSAGINLTHPWGSPGAAFPFSNTNFTHPESMPNTGGDRYQKLHYGGGGSITFFKLIQNVDNCKRYKLEYDIYSLNSASTSLEVSFGDANSITWPQNFTYYSPVLNFSTNSNATPGQGVWQHITKYFWYCGQSSNVLLLRNYTTGTPGSVLIDNVSLIEDLNPPPLTVTISSGGPCGNILTATPTNDECNLSFQWYLGNNTNNPIPGATSSTLTVNATTSATYTVVATSCGYTDDASFTFNPQNNGNCSVCTVFGNTPATQLGANGTISSNPPPDNYYITNNVDIDGDINLTGSVVYMGPNVTINVGADDKLTLNSSHLFGCDQMWIGINVTSNGVVSTDNSLIEDALDGITFSYPTLESPYNLNVTNTTFNRNLRSINILGCTQPNIAPHFTIRSSIFTSRKFENFTNYPYNWPSIGTLQAVISTTYPPFQSPYVIGTYDPQSLKNTNNATYGVHISNVGSTSGTTFNEIVVGVPASSDHTDFNIFDNLITGIAADGSNFCSVNNVFMKINDANSAGNGVGILAGPSGTAVATNHRARILPMTGNQANRFYDCHKAVEVNGYKEVYGEKSFMISNDVTTGNTSYGQYGYKVRSQDYRIIKLTDNFIYNIDRGIRVTSDISGTQTGGAIDVNGNRMDANPPGYSQTNRWMEHAITIENVIGCVTCPFNGVLKTENNMLTNIYNGISVEGFKQTGYCRGNTITLKNANTGQIQYGIKHSNTKNEHVSGNAVTGYGNSTTLGRAFYAVQNENYRAVCNSAITAGRGFDFSANSTTVQWMGNEMSNNKWSFALEGQIGWQFNNKKPCDNKWLVIPGSGFNYDATVNPQTTNIDYSNLANSILFVNNTPLKLPTYNYSSPYSANHNYSTTNGIHVTGFSFGPTPCPVKPVKQGGFGQPQIQLILGTLDQGPYTNTGGWIAQYNLWQGLVLDSTMYEEDSTGLLVQFKAMGYNSRFGMLAKIDSLLATGDSATARTHIDDSLLLIPQPDTNASGVVILDDTLANPVIENYIKYYHLYLAYLDSNLTLEDSLEVDSLASLCYLEHGNAVLEARVLYNILFNDMRQFENSCGGVEEDSSGARGLIPGYGFGPLSQVNVSGEQQYMLLPNPNNGNFTIQQVAVADGLVDMEVLTISGVSLRKMILQFKSGKTDVKLNGAAPGTYLLKLKDSEGVTCVIKFTIL